MGVWVEEYECSLRGIDWRDVRRASVSRGCFVLEEVLPEPWGEFIDALSRVRADSSQDVREVDEGVDVLESARDGEGEERCRRMSPTSLAL
jgi:hypothetical protein